MFVQLLNLESTLLMLMFLLFLHPVKIPRRPLQLTDEGLSSSGPGPAGLWSHLHSDTGGGQDAFCTGFLAELNTFTS